MESLIFHIRSFYSNLKCSCMLFWIWGDVVFAEKQLPEASYEKGFRRNFVKFTGKHLWQSLFFNKVAGQRLWYTCFPVNFAKFPRTHFVTEHLRSLLLSYFGPLSLNFVSMNMDLKWNVRIIQTTKLESLKFYLLTNVLQCAKLLMY